LSDAGKLRRTRADAIGAPGLSIGEIAGVTLGWSSRADAAGCPSGYDPFQQVQLHIAWRDAATADKIGGMLSLQMNDAAVRLLGLHEGLPSACLPGGIAPGLEDMLERGIVRRGQVVSIQAWD
jgi:hypothetical protein